MNDVSTSELEIIPKISDEFQKILTPDALAFIKELVINFSETRETLLRTRNIRQNEINEGKLPDFLKETTDIRNSSWTIAPILNDLQDRRVEITGPADRKMIINALNSGAKVFMADFEDSNSPTWENLIQGQINLKDAINRKISFESPEGKKYELNQNIATLSVRPRGWHLEEKHLLFNGKAISASLFDFGLFFYHNAKQLIDNGSGPYFYLPKLESYLEARLWNDVFVFAQEKLEIPIGTIKATVLIETIHAAFEMDEILYELKNHSSGLNCGRWDYIFSFIKKFRKQPKFMLPDRAQVTMNVPFMRAYSLLAIKTCHRRNAHSIGGMAAFIPVKAHQLANEEAFRQVRLDKIREAKNGHDGTWVAHPGLVPVAMTAFDLFMPNDNQIDKQLFDITIKSTNLLEVPDGSITEQGLRTNISVGIQYIESWLRGKGAVPINNLMEDAATAEISRAQVWQWIHNPAGILEDGRMVTEELYNQLLKEEMDKIKETIGEDSFNGLKFNDAIKIFNDISLSRDFVDFLTIPGYECLISNENI